MRRRRIPAGMTSLMVGLPSLAGVPREQLFPALTDQQIQRIAPHGGVHPFRRGEVLVEPGEVAPSFFLVTAGRIEIVRPSGATEQPIMTLGPGEFTGEVSMLSGRRTLVRIRAVDPGDAIRVDRERLLSLVQTDGALGEIILRAFILRRVELIARGIGDVVLVGSRHSAGTLRVQEFLTRNGHPYQYLDADLEPGVQQLLEGFQVAAADVPIVICRGEVVLRNPTNVEIADCLGFNASIGQSQLRDVVIIGAGPSGLAAAVYAASEGFDVLVIESNAPGGRAGASSRIENYLGFPTGISGQELSARAHEQAQKFGAQVMIARSATRLLCSRKPYAVELSDGSRIRARTIIIATGAEYRTLPIDNVARFVGNGVYFGASFIEAQVCRGEEVIVVGGANSAGQAAMFLARTARRVHLLVRAPTLARTMSRYLMRRIEQDPAIALEFDTEVSALEGDVHLERIEWRNTRTAATQTRPIRHVFVMAGADPSTGLLKECLALDPKGFIRTGPSLSPEDLASWPLPRPPHLLETSLPGVFAVGDVRADNIKRVASAVGEGSIAIAFVQQVLREPPIPTSNRFRHGDRLS